MKLRVAIVGGGVAALETALALRALAPDQTAAMVIAPNAHFVYRPAAVLEPFVFAPARRYPLAAIVSEARAELVADELASVDPDRGVVHTRAGRAVEYDALVLALGARIVARYTHAVTIDDRRIDQAFTALIDDLDAGEVERLAFLSPGRMAWPLPLYELALMTAGRARGEGRKLSIAIVTPEESPLAIFGAAASRAVAAALDRAGILTVCSAHAEVPAPGEVAIDGGARRLSADRVVALPELYGPCVRGIPLSEHGFVHVDSHGRVAGVERVYAAGDATDFPVKHGGLAAQQADAVAQSIAMLSGAPVAPEPFRPVIRGMLLTDSKPLYLTARIAGARVFDSSIADVPSWSPPEKIVAKHLAPCLDRRDVDRAILPAA